jgi:hypothetical protein
MPSVLVSKDADGAHAVAQANTVRRPLHQPSLSLAPCTPDAKWNGTSHVDQHRLRLRGCAPQIWPALPAKRAQDHSKSYTLLKWDYDLPHVLTKPSWMAHADLALARPALGKARGEVVNVGCSIIFGVQSRDCRPAAWRTAEADAVLRTIMLKSLVSPVRLVLRTAAAAAATTRTKRREREFGPGRKR